MGLRSRWGFKAERGQRRHLGHRESWQRRGLHLEGRGPPQNAVWGSWCGPKLESEARMKHMMSWHLWVYLSCEVPGARAEETRDRGRENRTRGRGQGWVVVGRTTSVSPSPAPGRAVRTALYRPSPPHPPVPHQWPGPGWPQLDMCSRETGPQATVSQVAMCGAAVTRRPSLGPTMLTPFTARV